MRVETAVFVSVQQAGGVPRLCVQEATEATEQLFRISPVRAGGTLTQADVSVPSACCQLLFQTII